MKLIGLGFSYKVYDLKDGYVIKKPTSDIYKLIIATTSYIFSKESTSISRYISEQKELTNFSINHLKNHLDIPQNLIGNPKFTNSLEYEQTKTKTLKSYFKKHTLEENKKVIDSYIKTVIILWKYGFADITYNLTINYGINKNNEVILIDLNELTTSKNQIKQHINSKYWLTQYSYSKLKDKKLKEYFTKEMEKNLTEKNLNKLWKTCM